MSEITRAIKRPDVLSKENFAEHLKTVGNAIKTDAGAIAHFAEGGQSVKIEAEVNPGEAVTTVRYIVERLADPRTKTANHLTEGE